MNHRIRGCIMRRSIFKSLSTALLGLGLIAAQPVLSGDTSLPDQPQVRSPATRSVLSDVETKAAETAEKQRKKIVTEARAALDETQEALQALENEDAETALKSLETATGKLELMGIRSINGPFARV
jgi:hypothetical protein